MNLIRLPSLNQLKILCIKAIRIGSWIRIGRQPESGLTFFFIKSHNRFICSSLLCLYCSFFYFRLDSGHLFLCLNAFL